MIHYTEYGGNTNTMETDPQLVRELVTVFHEQFGILPPVHTEGTSSLATMWQMAIHAGYGTNEDLSTYLEKANNQRGAADLSLLTR